MALRVRASASRPIPRAVDRSPWTAAPRPPPAFGLQRLAELQTRARIWDIPPALCPYCHDALLYAPPLFRGFWQGALEFCRLPTIHRMLFGGVSPVLPGGRFRIGVAVATDAFGPARPSMRDAAAIWSWLKKCVAHPFPHAFRRWPVQGVTVFLYSKGTRAHSLSGEPRRARYDIRPPSRARRAAIAGRTNAPEPGWTFRPPGNKDALPIEIDLVVAGSRTSAPRHHLTVSDIPFSGVARPALPERTKGISARVTWPRGTRGGSRTCKSHACGASVIEVLVRTHRGRSRARATTVLHPAEGATARTPA
jgi:hypothetical protein